MGNMGKIVGVVRKYWPLVLVVGMQAVTETSSVGRESEMGLVAECGCGEYVGRREWEISGQNGG